MADAYEYAIVRVVPDVVREEFINVGVIVLCEARDFLTARVELDEARLRALGPDVDVEELRAHLASYERICEGAGPMGQLPLRERFRWLVAPRNAAVQSSCAHGGLTKDPSGTLEHLLEKMVRPRTG